MAQSRFQQRYARDPALRAAARARAARQRAADPERQRGYKRTYEATPKGRASKARTRAAHPEIQRRADARRAGPHRGLKRWHGMTPEDWAAMVDAQAGRCYLCSGELETENRRRAHVEHLHDHCGPDRSCRACRRGIACARCNMIAGLAGDDPALLTQIAEALTTANAAARARIAALPVQDRLFD